MAGSYDDKSLAIGGRNIARGRTCRYRRRSEAPRALRREDASASTGRANGRQLKMAIIYYLAFV